ncbi:MAG TPA: squalene/phytoene synthase family protein [Thermoanaerobaculia bacterium]|nr:squalene/phytoene synthase family protein [Thermoanaerobaculia bacterium]
MSSERGDVAEAYAFCRAITHRHGANFSVGFRFLPKEKRRAVWAAYAWCRRADDIADEPGSDVAERLDAWQAELDCCYAGAPQHPITIALADSLRRFAIPKSAFVALIDGCRQDMVKSRYATFEELLHYCDLVASSISEVSLSIFGYRTEAAKEYGRNLSTALQLTNVTRDVGDDLDRDRIYIPAEEMERFGVSERDLVERRKTPAVEALIRFQVERATGWFRAAEPLLGELAFDARFPTLLMGSVYARVLAKIRREPFAPLERRVSLSFGEKLGVVAGRLLQPHFV